MKGSWYDYLAVVVLYVLFFWGLLVHKENTP